MRVRDLLKTGSRRERFEFEGLFLDPIDEPSLDEIEEILEGFDQ